MSRSAASLTFLLLLLPICGCGKRDAHPAAAPAGPAMKQPPSTPLQEKKEELGGNTWKPEWDVLIERSLPTTLLSGDVRRAVASFCPRFGEIGEADRRAFWAYLFQALSGAEAGFRETTTVHHTQAVMEKTDAVTERPIRQEGLLQLAYEDEQRYGCDFDWQRDRRLPAGDPRRSILDPARNLSCGLKIMANQLVRQGKPLITKSSYWSTLQPGTTSYGVFAKQMVNVPSACGVGARQIRHAGEPGRPQHNQSGRRSIGTPRVQAQ